MWLALSEIKFHHDIISFVHCYNHISLKLQSFEILRVVHSVQALVFVFLIQFKLMFLVMFIIQGIILLLLKGVWY